MQKYFNNNFKEISEIQINNYSNINPYYNNISTNTNINHKKIKHENEMEKYNEDYTSDNIESEIETDLKKFAKTFNMKNQKNYYDAKEEKKVDLIENYLIKLKNYGYPEMGKIYLSPDLQEQEKTFNFFEYIIKKESLNINDREKYKDKYEELEYQIQNLKQELNKEIKSNSLTQKDLEFKIKKQKDYYDKQFYLKTIINKITIEKNNLEQKMKNLNETKINLNP